MASFNNKEGKGVGAWGTKSDKGAWGGSNKDSFKDSANRGGGGGGRGYPARDTSASWGDARNKKTDRGAAGRGAGGRGGAAGKTHHARPTEKACEECNAPFCSPFACMITKVKKEFTEVQVSAYVWLFVIT